MEKNNVFITLDYELFFGDKQGTYQKSIVYPTNLLRKVAKKNQVNFTFFIDIGYIIKLEENKYIFPELEEELETIKNQIKDLVEEGHDCQLHIHPHWEKAIYKDKSWVFDFRFYKLADFSPNEIELIFTKYKIKLEEITERKIHSFRAGGWCIQPFSLVKSSFEHNEIKIDSSVFKNGKHIDEVYNYDFTACPSKSYWKFEDNESQENKNGQFVELPISSYRYTPFFFWRLFVFGNLFPKNHKPIGDGKPMKSNLTRKKLLTQTHLFSASIDGYFCSKMKKIIQKNEKVGCKETVFIGHPKALTHFSVNFLDEFIRKNKNKLNFKTFTQFYNEVY